jgi:hypothetical protein
MSSVTSAWLECGTTSACDPALPLKLLKTYAPAARGGLGCHRSRRATSKCSTRLSYTDLTLPNCAVSVWKRQVAFPRCFPRCFPRQALFGGLNSRVWLIEIWKVWSRDREQQEIIMLGGALFKPVSHDAPHMRPHRSDVRGSIWAWLYLFFSSCPMVNSVFFQYFRPDQKSHQIV